MTTELEQLQRDLDYWNTRLHEAQSTAERIQERIKNLEAAMAPKKPVKPLHRPQFPRDATAQPSGAGVEASGDSPRDPAKHMLPASQFVMNNVAAPIPLNDNPNEVDCNVCGGTGHLECRKCNPEGYVRNIWGDLTLCPECDGDGQRECKHCKGTGKLELDASPVPAQPPAVSAAPFAVEVSRAELDPHTHKGFIMGTDKFVDCPYDITSKDDIWAFGNVISPIGGGAPIFKAISEYRYLTAQAAVDAANAYRADQPTTAPRESGAAKLSVARKLTPAMKQVLFVLTNRPEWIIDATGAIFEKENGNLVSCHIDGFGKRGLQQSTLIGLEERGVIEKYDITHKSFWSTGTAWRLTSDEWLALGNGE